MKERDDQLITNAFTFGEVLAVVYRRGAKRAAEETRHLLNSAISEVIPLTAKTADRYAQLRGSLGFSPADAIHLASAAETGRGLFLTNDATLVGKFVPGIHFIAPLDTDLF
jgi:predicted nucleic acid-binding protein